MIRRLAPALGLAILASCGSARRYVATPGPYDRVPPAWSVPLGEARALVQVGRLRDAHDLVYELVRARPELLPVRVFLQDLQLALLESGEFVGGFALPEGADQAASLGDRYRQSADANPHPAEYVLAARLQRRPEAALALLAEAEALDAACVWVHYGKGWWNARRRRFPEAREAVARAFELDGGHLPTMRLHASLQAGAGESRDAIECLEPWIERTRNDPLADPNERAEAIVDLASLWILEQEPGRALSWLGRVRAPDLRDAGRAEIVRAVALEALGRRQEALAAAGEALRDDPSGLLPRVHQAMLLRARGDLGGERAIWEEILVQAEENAAQEEERRRARPDEGSVEDVDFVSLMIRLRAHTRLARLARELGPQEAAAPVPGTPVRP